jgi:hypothetical protein
MADRDLPDISAFPGELKGCKPRIIARRACRKCSRITNVAYMDASGRGWPICFACAIASEGCACGTIGRGDTVWDGVHDRFLIRHKDGNVCTPIQARERYRIPCSSCGGELVFTVLARRWNDKGIDHLSCGACGAKWRLESLAYPPIRVSLEGAPPTGIGYA